MKTDKSFKLQVKLQITDGGDTPPLHAYLFGAGSQPVAQAAVQKDAAVFEVPGALAGQTLQLALGPAPAKGTSAPGATELTRAGAYVQSLRALPDRAVNLSVISHVFPPRWCLCFVRGRLVKRYTLPDGTPKELPVCNARVHICEVDRIPILIERLPDPDILRLRDDLLDKLRPLPRPPIPIPDPGPLHALGLRSAAAGPQAMAAPTMEQPAAAEPAGALQPLSAYSGEAIAALSGATSVASARARLLDLVDLIIIRLCDLPWLCRWLRMDCLRVVDADAQGRFSSLIFHDCRDQPDLYFWVEQFQNGAWTTVYRPSACCGTYWNYACGSEVVLNLPGAVACDDPPYDLPPGVTLFVLPWAIGNAPVWGIPSGAPPAPDGWVRPDGLINYATGSSLGWLFDAPFGDLLNFIHDDSYFIPSSGIKYYRYAWRRYNAANPANTGAADPSWTPIATPLARGYRMEYSDRLPTYESYPVGPHTVGANNSLFEFKPQTPPARGTDPASVVVREWTSGNLSEVAAQWNTLQAAPPLSPTNASDDAGPFEVKIEVFDPAGNQVMPGPATFAFLARNADNHTTRPATAAELAGGAYVLRVHVDNNGVDTALPQPSIGGVAASDDCGFLRYAPTDLVHLQFHASHPNNRAVFRFGITRGSNGLASATTLAPYVETAAVVAPTTSNPYVLSSGDYQRNFAPVELVGTCVNAAFAASLNVYGKATNGYWRLGYDGYRLIAFALAIKPGP